MPQDPITRRLDRRARRHRGLLTRADLADEGLSRRQIEHRVATGQLVAVRRAIYRLAGATPTWEQSLQAAVLAAPPRSAASHLAAARHHRLRGIDADLLEITVPTPCRLAGVDIHVSSYLPPADITRRGGIDVTTVARTVCDLSGRVPITVLGRALDECLRAELTLTAVQRCAARLLAAHGARRLGDIRELLGARADGPALGNSVLEGKILAWLREAGLPDPVTQYRFRRRNRSADRFDLAYPELRIAIELLGWYEHGKRGAFEPGQTRRNRGEVAGWLILEFGDRHSRGEVIETVTAARAAQQEALRQLARFAGRAG